MSSSRQLPLLAALALCACQPHLDDNRYPTGSTTLVATSDARSVYVANVDEGTLTRVDLATNATTEIAVGSEPTRVARIGDRILVTLRDTGAIAEVRDGAAPSVIRTVPVGTEPFGIVASEDGTRVYVALSTENRVVELDGTTLATLRSFPVDGEPRWLALHPSGKSVYVGSPYGANVRCIHLGSGDTETLALPEADGATGNPLSPRITGDLAISPDGSMLAIPSLYVDNTTEPTEVTPATPVAYYSSAGLGVSRMNSVIGLVELDRGDGSPQTDIDPMFYTAQAAPIGADPFGSQVETVRSYPSSVTFSPDGHLLWATMEASNAVAVMPVAPMHLQDDDVFSDTAASRNGFSVTRSAEAVITPRGPRGLAFVGDKPIVHSFIDRTIAPLDAERMNELAQGHLDGQRNWFDEDLATGGSSGEAITVSRSQMSTDVELGRALFYSATEDGMVANGAGVSCSTCHFDGKNDGLSWHLHPGDSGFRNTPSLRGGIESTAPFTWTEDVASVADEASITSEMRMGGTGVTALDLQHIQAFVHQQRAPHFPQASEAAIARGREAFVASGCDTCHTASSSFVDATPHRVLDIEVDTPTLRGVAGTAPYFHDGSAGSLEAVLLLSDAGLMGDTSRLSAAEKADLLDYLKSL